MMEELLHQLRLVVFSQYLQGFTDPQVVQDFFHQQYHCCNMHDNAAWKKIRQLPRTTAQESLAKALKLAEDDVLTLKNMKISIFFWVVVSIFFSFSPLFGEDFRF